MDTKKKWKQITWDDITVDMFERIREVSPSTRNEQNIEPGDELDRIIKILSIVTGLPEDEYLNMTFEELNLRVKDLAFLYEKPEERFTGRDYTLNGTEYVLAVNAQQMITAQYIDMMNILRHSPDDVARLLSCVLVPKGMAYNDGYDIAKAGDDIRHHLPYIDALGISFFFAKASEILMQASRACLVKKLNRQTKKLTRIMKKETDAVKKAAMMKATDHIRQCMDGISSWGK